MKILMLKNAFKPDGSKAPTILKRNTFHDIPDDQAKILIEKEYAVAEKPVDAEDTRTPYEIREAEVKPLTKDPLIELLAKYGLNDEKNNDDRKAKIMEVEFTEEGEKRTEEEIKEYVATLTPAA